MKITRDEAAEKYARVMHNIHAGHVSTEFTIAEDFRAGYDAALAEPTDAEVQASLITFYEEQHDSLKTGVTFERADFGEADFREMRLALTTFVTARKGKTQ